MAIALALLFASIALLRAARLLANRRAWAYLLAIYYFLIIAALRRAAIAYLLAAIVLALLAAAALFRAIRIALRLLAAKIFC